MDLMKKTARAYADMRAQITEERATLPLTIMASSFGLDWKERRSLVAGLLDVVRDNDEEAEAAQAAWGLLAPHKGRVDHNLRQRAQQIANQVFTHIRGPQILDFGCGDGRVAHHLDWFRSGDDLEISLTDVTDGRNEHLPKVMAMPFSLVSDLGDDLFNTTLLLTVLHHCDDPHKIFKLVDSVTMDRIIVIESPLSKAMDWEVQFLVDWLYNRGMHPGVEIPVPGNFREVNLWLELFAGRGWRPVHEESFGFDMLEIVPESHYLLVLER